MDLNNLSAKDYEKLKLRNVEISEKNQNVVEDRLIRERFFRSIVDANNLPITADKNAEDTSFKKIDVIYERIKIVFIAVDDFTASLREEVDLDLSKTLFIARFIAQNIRILKRQLKSTYNQLPWEEIEFCLSLFAFLSTVERRKLQGHLINFADKLSRIFNYNIDFSDVKDRRIFNGSIDLSNDKVAVITNKITKYIHQGIPRNREKVAGFESLYSDYELIKDLYSLSKMLHYIELALSVSPKEQSGRLVIERALQVIGEYLKDSPQSPHLSDSTELTLIQMKMAVTIEIAPSLRNLLSHNNNFDRLFSRNCIEKDEGFFTKIQGDLRKIQVVFTEVLYDVKMRHYEKLCEDILSNDDSKIVKELCDQFIKKVLLEKAELVDAKTHDTDVLNKIVNLVGEMHKIINSKIEYKNPIIKPLYTTNLEGEDNNEQLFIKIESIIASERNKITYIRTQLETIIDVVYTIKLSAKEGNDRLKETKKQHERTLRMIQTENSIVNFMIIMELINEISNNFEEHDKYKEIQSLVIELDCIIFSQRIRTNVIAAFKEKLGTLEIDTSVREDKVESELNDVLNTFKTEVNDEKKYNELKFKLNSRKRIHQTKLKLISHFEGKNKLTELEYKQLVEGLDEAKGKKGELLNNFDFEGYRDRRKQLVENSLDNYGKFFESKIDFNTLLISLKLESTNKTAIKNIFDPIKQLHIDPESLLHKLKINLPDTELIVLNRKLEDKKQAHTAKQQLIASFQNNSEITATEYGQLVDKLDTSDTNKGELNKLYSPLSKAILAVESLNDSYGAFIKAVEKKETTINEIYNSFNKFSESLKLGSESQKLLKKIFKEKRIEILEDYFREKLRLLKDRLDNVKEFHGSKNLVISHYKKDKKLQAEVEMLLLDLSDISSNIDQPPLRCLEEEFLSLDGDFPFLMGVSLRNYLAHGDALIDSLPFDPLIAVISNAFIFTEEGESIIALWNLVKDSKMEKYLNNNVNNIGDKLGKEELPTELQQHADSIATLQRSDYWKDYLKNMLSNKGKGTRPVVQSDVASRYAENLKPFISLKKLFDAVKENDKQALQNCLEKGEKIDARDHKMWTLLHTAAHKGHKDILETLLNKRANINSINEDESTPLHLAAENGRHLVVEVLLNRGAKVNAIDKDGFTSLHKATLHGHKETVEILLNNGADITSKAKDGSLPFHAAAGYGNMDIIKLLVEKKDTDVDAKNNNGDTPLTLAALARHTKGEVVKYLLEKGAIVDFKDNQKSTALYTAARRGNKDIVQTLLDNGANVNSINEDEYTPLHIAAINGHDEVVEVLLRRGANVDATCKNGRVPLHFAASSENSKTIEYLLKNGSKVDIKDNNGLIPLHFAINLDVVKSLVDTRNSDVNIADKYKRTPLHYAVRKNNLNVIKFLVEKGADVNAPDEIGYIPLHYWRSGPYSDVNIIGHLIEKGVNLNIRGSENRTLMHIVAIDGDMTVAQYIVGKNAEVNVRDKNNMTPLHCAALMGNLNVVEFLVNKGAEVNASDNKKCTSLHYAAKRGYNEIVEFLLNKDAQINDKDRNDRNGLYLAAKAGHIKVVNTFLKKNINTGIVNVSDKYKMTPLHAAADSGYKNVVEVLLKNEASLDIRDNYGRTPLHLAVRNGNLGVIKSLVDKGANVDASDNKKRTPLHFASLQADEDVIKILLNNRATVNAADNQNNTPLLCAASRGDEKVVEVLLNGGAEVNLRNDYNMIPLDFALATDNVKTVELLLKNVDKNPLHWADINDYLAVVKNSIKSGYNVNAVDEKKMTPLHLASLHGNLHVVEFLIKKKGVDINAVEGSNLTSLNLAAYNGYVEIVKILLSNGARVDIGNNTGVTPLHSAAANGYKNIVEILLKYDAKTEVTVENGSTPLHYAVNEGHKDVIKVLVENGADIDVKNNEGHTPLNYATNSIKKILWEGMINGKILKMRVDKEERRTEREREERRVVEGGDAGRESKGRKYREMDG